MSNGKGNLIRIHPVGRVARPTADYGTMAIGVCQKAARLPVGSMTVT
jgi:hypothetical protein